MFIHLYFDYDNGVWSRQSYFILVSIIFILFDIAISTRYLEENGFFVLSYLNQNGVETPVDDYLHFRSEI